MECRRRYGLNFAEIFSPQNQGPYCVDKNRLFGGKAPTLAVVAAAYGRNMAESWIEVQLKDLSEYAGCKEKMTVEQMDDVSRVVMTLYPWLKVTELMYFFLLMKGGRFGHFYGAVDGMVVTGALHDFMAIRASELARMEREKTEEARKDGLQGCVSREEWRRMKMQRTLGVGWAVRPDVWPKEVVWNIKDRENGEEGDI